MSSVLSRLAGWSKQYPIVRGVALYAVLWPSSSLCQQAIARVDKFDFVQAGRYGVYGCLVVVPMLHVWLKISNFWFPQMNLKTALIKVLIEQVSYGPLALACFLTGMSFLEGGTIDDALSELRSKFFSTMKVTHVCSLNHPYLPAAACTPASSGSRSWDSNPRTTLAT